MIYAFNRAIYRDKCSLLIDSEPRELFIGIDVRRHLHPSPDIGCHPTYHPSSWETFIYSYIFFSRFMLYPVNSRISRGNLVLRHSVPHFPLSSAGSAYWMVELNTALCFIIRASKWKCEIFYFPNWESYPQPVAVKLAHLCRCATSGLILL